MSSILRRPDCQGTNVIPDANMLKKLIRDCNCPLVIRGVLESLLRFVTEDLPRWSTGNRGQKQSTSGRVTREDHSDQRESLKSQPAGTGSQILKSSSDPQKVKLPRKSGENPKSVNIKPRRLTSFQLLQSKFTRASPKPPETHQREVGTLSFSKGLTHEVGRCQEMHKKDRAKIEHGQRRGSRVKDMVARFVMAEEKGRGQRTSERQTVKPRLLGKGSLLSCLKERFESMATVRHEGDLKDSHRRSDREMMSGVKDKVACYEKGQQQVREETLHQLVQLQKMKSKTSTQSSNRNQNGNQLKRRAEEADEVKSDLREETGSESPRLLDLGEEHEYTDDDQESCECREVQSAADETRPFIEPSFKHGSTALLCLTSVSQWSGPEPHRLSPQVLTPLECHVVTITTCCPTWSSCSDVTPKQHLHENKSSHIAPAQYTHSDSKAGKSYELFPLSSEEPNVQETNTDTDIEPMVTKAAEGHPRPQTGPKSFHQYVIPRVYRSDLQPSPEQENNSLLSEHVRTEAQNTPESENGEMEVKTLEKSLDPSLSSETAFHNTPCTKPAETEQQENAVKSEEEKVKETPLDKEFDTTKISSHNFDVLRRMTEMEPTEPEPEVKAQRLKEEPQKQSLLAFGNRTDKHMSNDVSHPNGSETKSTENQPRQKVTESGHKIETLTLAEGHDISKHKPSNKNVCHDVEEVTTADVKDVKQVERREEEGQSPVDSEVESGGTGTFEGSVPGTEPELEASPPRPKYKTINYADPSVKKSFKPKIIRFTDTFTF